MQSWNLPKKIISGKNLHIFVLCSFSHLNITHTALVCITDIEDRKSTRLNSSHSQISYAVFCLKKTHRRPLVRAAGRDDRGAEIAVPAARRPGRTGRARDARRPDDRRIAGDRAALLSRGPRADA